MPQQNLKLTHFLPDEDWKEIALKYEPLTAREINRTGRRYFFMESDWETPGSGITPQDIYFAPELACCPFSKLLIDHFLDPETHMLYPVGYCHLVGTLHPLTSALRKKAVLWETLGGLANGEGTIGVGAMLQLLKASLGNSLTDVQIQRLVASFLGTTVQLDFDMFSRVIPDNEIKMKMGAEMHILQAG